MLTRRVRLKRRPLPWRLFSSRRASTADGRASAQLPCLPPCLSPCLPPCLPRCFPRVSPVCPRALPATRVRIVAIDGNSMAIPSFLTRFSCHAGEWLALRPCSSDVIAGLSCLSCIGSCYVLVRDLLTWQRVTLRRDWSLQWKMNRCCTVPVWSRSRLVSLVPIETSWLDFDLTVAPCFNLCKRVAFNRASGKWIALSAPPLLHVDPAVDQWRHWWFRPGFNSDTCRDRTPLLRLFLPPVSHVIPLIVPIGVDAVNRVQWKRIQLRAITSWNLHKPLSLIL